MMGSEPAPPLNQACFLEDHGSVRQRWRRNEFLDRENRLDQFRRARPRLESLQQPGPDSRTPNQVVADLGQPRVIAARNDPNAVKVQFLELPKELVGQT